MESVRRSMNLSEHCPDCGALLVAVPGGSLCPHCGCELEDPEERMVASLTRLPGAIGAGARFHLLDDFPEESLDRAA